MRVRSGNAVVIGVVILAVVLVLAGGGYYYLRSRNTTQTSSSNSTTGTTQTDDGSFSGSLDQLAGSGQARECTFTTNTASGSGQGHNYSDGKGRARLTINTTSAKTGEAGQTDTLLKGDGKSYVWMTGQGGTLGYVMTLKSPAATASTAATPASGNSAAAAAASQNYQMSCQRWTVDESKFELPAGVNFQSFPGL